MVKRVTGILIITEWSKKVRFIQIQAMRSWLLATVRGNRGQRFGIRRFTRATRRPHHPQSRRPKPMPIATPAVPNAKLWVPENMLIIGCLMSNCNLTTSESAFSRFLVMAIQDARTNWQKYDGLVTSSCLQVGVHLD